MTGHVSRLGRLLADARRAYGWSLADLAGATFASRGWINNVEAGRRWPSRHWVALAEEALHASSLVAEWDRADQERATKEGIQLLLREAERQSALLLASPDAVDLDRLGEGAANLAVAYLASPPRPMLEHAMAMRTELLRRTTLGVVRQSELPDLHVAAGRLSGVLAYAALDLGYAQLAGTHGAAAFRLGELAGNIELLAWSRGTQSLIARFEQDYARAREFIRDGLRYAGVGTSTVRLLCGAAQCAANLGDGSAAMRHIADAKRARERSGPDAVEGLFGFSPAKQSYYSASALMWLPDGQSLSVAESSAIDAIDLWQHEPVEQRSLDDEALAHVYLATARLKLGDVDGAMDAVRPIIDLPAERHISWIRKRMDGLGDILASDRFRNSAAASHARDELAEYVGTA